MNPTDLSRFFAMASFFERADMLDTKVGQDKKADPAEVAKAQPGTAKAR
jgi:hypothetical protein